MWLRHVIEDYGFDKIEGYGEEIRATMPRNHGQSNFETRLRQSGREIPKQGAHEDQSLEEHVVPARVPDRRSTGTREYPSRDVVEEEGKGNGVHWQQENNDKDERTLKLMSCQGESSNALVNNGYNYTPPS